jgi:hypothetical protein
MVTAVMAGCAAVVMLAVPGLAAQMPHQQQAAAAKAEQTPGMDAKCKAMMAEHENMMTDMKAADERLDGLVAAMNTASGMEKTAATSAVVAAMVTEQRSMRDGMMKMQQDMMGHMMEHMQAGKESMGSCPMMKQMGDMKH